MNLPYMPGVRRVSPAGLPCDPGRVESGVRKRFRFIALLTLAVFMAGGTAASAATIANHMDYPVEGFSLWCQDPQQHWASGHGAESRRHAARRPLLLS